MMQKVWSPVLDQASTKKALESGSHLAVFVDEPLLVSGLHPKSHHIERRHVIPPFVLFDHA